MAEKGYADIRELIDCEIDKIAKKPELTKESLAALDVLVDIIKDLDEISRSQHDGYSQRYYNQGGYSGTGGRSYGKFYNGWMYDDSDGYGNRGSYRMNSGYSRHDQKENLIHQMEMLMDDASPAQREAIQSIISQMTTM